MKTVTLRVVTSKRLYENWKEARNIKKGEKDKAITKLIKNDLKEVKKNEK